MLCIICILACILGKHVHSELARLIAEIFKDTGFHENSEYIFYMYYISIFSIFNLCILSTVNPQSITDPTKKDKTNDELVPADFLKTSY